MGFSFFNMNIDQLYKLFRQSTGVCTDSRNVAPGSIFFALRGDHFDGNLYAGSALEAGASFVVVDSFEIVKDERYIYSENTLKTLQDLANYHRKTLKIPLLAITGSNGKTTTKELTAAVLSKKYNTGVTKGNLNNHIGVPLTLLSMNEKTEFGLVEMGANHPGEIDQLCRIAEPGFGLITNIGKAHLEGFGSFEGVIRTKTELYRFLEGINGTVFYNADNELLAGLVKEIKNKVTYGSGENCLLKAGLTGHVPFVTLKTRFNSFENEIPTQLTGSYNFENIAAAACVGTFFGVDQMQIREAIGSYVPSNNRSQVIQQGTNTIILDAYNANPSSMIASIRNFLTYPDKNKILIIGDMLELGSYSASEHQLIVDFIVEQNFNRIILVGGNFRLTNKPTHVVSLGDVNELRGYLAEHPVTGSLVLLKGSRGMKLEQSLPLI